MQRSRAGMHIAGLLVLAAVTAGRGEAQGPPVRVSIGVRAEVLPLPAPQTVTVDATAAAATRQVTAMPADTAGARVRRQRLVVVSYPGT